ncbi:MAG: tail fiber assembly protein [Clostridium butyricum]|nr:tail fiber assembly protein [Clostridium butyricum]
MKPVFDENGLAMQAGDIRCFYYDAVTMEYAGWSDEYINAGVSMPGNSTDIDPGEMVAGKVFLFTGTGWRQDEDHRGETVDGKKWVTDTDAQHAADVEAADQKKAALLAEAQEKISLWQTELQLGSISNEDKESLIAWVQYIKAVQAIDTSSAPNINWPVKPE